MILGTGCDLTSVARIRKAVEQQSFVDKVFTAAEQSEAAQYRDPGDYYAGRWAAKEAAAKALGCGFGGRCAPVEIEILHGENGQPYIELNGKLKELYGELTLSVSLSHTESYAVATVLAYRQTEAEAEA